jgi:hypothetical protein
LTGLISLPLFVRLRSLDLTENRIHPGELMPLFRGPPLEQLARLKLTGEYLNEDAFRALLTSGRLACLTDLEVSGWCVRPGWLALLCEAALPRLTCLDLSHVNLSGEGVRALAQAPLLRQLTSLRLFNCRLGGDDCKALANSPHLGNLRHLDLDYNDVGAAGAEALACSRGLSLLSLDVSRNSLGDEGARALASGLRGLKALDASLNGLGAEGARALAESPLLADLVTLNLALNQISDAGAAALAGSAGAATLRHLALYNNPIGEDGARALAASAHLGQLRTLDVGPGLPDDAVVALVDSPGLPNLISLSNYSSPHMDLLALLRRAGKGVAR